MQIFLCCWFYLNHYSGARFVVQLLLDRVVNFKTKRKPLYRSVAATSGQCGTICPSRCLQLPLTGVSDEAFSDETTSL